MKTQFTLTVATLGVLMTTGCGADLDPECRRSSQCAGNGYCLAGECAAPPRTQFPQLDLGVDRRPLLPITDQGEPTIRDGTDAEPQDADQTTEALPGKCANAERPAPGSIVINEVLANVPAGLEGDANEDGARDAYEDEFVELVNRSTTTVELFGAALYLDEKLVFTFEHQCLDPFESLVVFGGGSPALPASDQKVIASDRRIGLRNEGGTISFVSAESALISHLEYGDGDARSWVRIPELVGETAQPHAPGLFSPGTCADGSEFSSGCSLPPPDQEPDAG